jgi:GNAT superfamily N-acetyltransferase
MMSEITIKQAGAADLPAAALLFDQYRQCQGESSDVVKAEDFLRQRLDHGEAVIFLAFINDQHGAVGFAQLYPIFSSVSLKRVFILNDLFVAEQGRRSGVAAELLAAIETYAWSMGASALRLNVKRANPNAIELYEKTGWQRDGEFFMYQQFQK